MEKDINEILQKLNKLDELTPIKNHMKKIQEDVAGINNRIRGVEEDVQDLYDKKEFLEFKVNDMEERMDYLENQSRRNNLIIRGLEGSPNETWEETENLVIKFAVEKLNVTLDRSEIERAHRILSAKGPIKPVIVKFFSFRSKQKILSNRKALKGTSYILMEDFSQRIIQERKMLLPKMHELRKQGKRAVLSFNRLKVQDDQGPRTLRYDFNSEEIVEEGKNIDPEPSNAESPEERRNGNKRAKPQMYAPNRKLQTRRKAKTFEASGQNLRNWLTGGEMSNYSQCVDDPEPHNP